MGCVPVRPSSSRVKGSNDKSPNAGATFRDTTRSVLPALKSNSSVAGNVYRLRQEFTNATQNYSPGFTHINIHNTNAYNVYKAFSLFCFDSSITTIEVS